MTNDADDLDRAAELSQNLVDSAVALSQRAVQPQQKQNPDGTWPQTDCEDCGGDIEEGRLLMGRIRCYHCQSALELRQKGY